MIMSRQPAGSASKENERPRPRPQHVPQRPTLSLTPETVVDDRDIEGNSTYNAAVDPAREGPFVNNEPSKAGRTHRSVPQARGKDGQVPIALRAHAQPGAPPQALAWDLTRSTSQKKKKVCVV